MSSSSSSPLSISSDPGTYISILPNIKRKAINGGARPQAFDNHLHSILLIINSAQYSRYTESDRAWHIDLFMWEHYCGSPPFPFRMKTYLKNSHTTFSHRTFPFPNGYRSAPQRQHKHDDHPEPLCSSSCRHHLLFSASCTASGHTRSRPELSVRGSGWCCVCAKLGDGRSTANDDDESALCNE